MTLSDITCGSRARILCLSHLTSDNRRRLLAMGLVPGAELTLLRIAPFGDPLVIEILGTQLMLRKKDARAIHVEAIPNEC